MNTEVRPLRPAPNRRGLPPSRRFGAAAVPRRPRSEPAAELQLVIAAKKRGSDAAQR